MLDTPAFLAVPFGCGQLARLLFKECPSSQTVIAVLTSTIVSSHTRLNHYDCNFFVYGEIAEFVRSTELPTRNIFVSQLLEIHAQQRANWLWIVQTCSRQNVPHESQTTPAPVGDHIRLALPITVQL